MDRGDDDVELGEAVVGEIHRAVGPDVALDAGEHGDAVEPLAQGADAAGLLERAPLVEPVGHRQRLAVIGDRDVGEAGVAGGARHRLGIGAAVGGGGVHVQIAAQIGEASRARQGAALGGLDLAAVLAQLRRDEGESERPVDVLLGAAGDGLPSSSRR